MNTIKIIWQKWSIAFKIMPLVITIAILKFLSNKFGFEVMELNALFTSLVAGTIFLIGFLISEVLSDYKESEKNPSEIWLPLKLYLMMLTLSKKVKTLIQLINLLNFKSHLLIL